MPLELLSESGEEPVTVEEARTTARVDEGELDALILGVISAARRQAEHLTGRLFRPQVLRVQLECWPGVRQAFAVYQASSVAISYWTGSAWSPLDPSQFKAFPAGPGYVQTGVAPALGGAWPQLGDVAGGPRVRIDFTAGIADPALVPENVKLYIKAQVAAWLRNPEAIAANTVVLNPMFDRLLDRELLSF